MSWRNPSRSVDNDPESVDMALLASRPADGQGHEGTDPEHEDIEYSDRVDEGTRDSIDHGSAAPARSSASESLRSPPVNKEGEALVPPQVVKWGVYWQKPVTILSFTLVGTALAVANHLVYHHLDGMAAGSAASQQWYTNLGTAFSFLIVALLNAACASAYAQYAWMVARKNYVSVGGLDSLFGMTGDISGFWSGEMWRIGKGAMLFSLTCWFMNFTGVFPPGTLTVVPGFSSRTTSTNVSSFDFTKYDNRLFLYPVPDSEQPVAVPLRLISEVAQEMTVQALTPPAPNSTYNLQFLGPALECQSANSTQQQAFDHFNDAVQSQDNTITVQQFLADPSSINNGTGFQIYSAFSPTLYGFTTDGNRIPGQPDAYDNWPAALPSNVTRDITKGGPAELWVQLSNESIVCTLVEASFDIGFNYTNGQQNITQNNVTFNDPVILYPPHTTNPQVIDHSYVAVLMAVANMLYGNVTLSPNSPGFLLGSTSTSRIQTTGLVACAEIEKNWWVENVAQLHKDIPYPNSPAFTFADQPWQCRNGSIAKALEDLSINATISLLGLGVNPDGNSVNTNKSVPVTFLLTDNIYSYNSLTLLLSYSIGVIFAVVASTTGIISMFINGVSHSGPSFSAILSTTRNPVLDVLANGQSLAAEPLAEKFEHMKLKLGALIEDRPSGVASYSEDGEGTDGKHIAFGLEGTVLPLKKGSIYT